MALTIRGLCQELGLTAPVVYRFFANKAEIEQALVQRLASPQALSAPSDEEVVPWLRDLFLHIWRIHQAYPELMTRMAETDALVAQSMATAEMAIEVLRRAGLSPQLAGAAFQSLMAYAIGAAMLALGTKVGDSSMHGMMPQFPNLLSVGIALDSREENVVRQGLERIIASYGIAQSE